MKLALGFALSALVLLLLALVPGNPLREMLIFFTGTNVVLALRAGEIARFGKGR